MEPSIDNGDYYRSAVSPEGPVDGRLSLEAGPPPQQQQQQQQRPSRIQERRSNADMRGETHGQPLSSPIPRTMAIRESMAPMGGFGEGAKARKGSIRNAVRKIFGKRSRQSQGPELAATSGPMSRHAYHKSEPTTALAPPRELSELSAYPQDGLVQPTTFPDPYSTTSPPPFNRTGSPYAIQFPKSVRLKPMDLGNLPQTQQQQTSSTQLRRRKTLPSLIIAEREAAAAAIAAQAPAPAREPPSETIRDRQTVVFAPSQIKKNRRKSRSTDDLKGTLGSEGTPPRKRSEEIRYWRDSLQPDVVRASGFTSNLARSPPRESEEPVSNFSRKSPRNVVLVEEKEEVETPVPEVADPFVPASTAVSRSGTFRSSPPIHGHTRGPSAADSDFRGSSGIGTEMSRDLEDRVAKLEAGLHNFQRSLQRLTADRNRRTVIMGSITTRRSSTDMRTPSLLADTLADTLEPSSYQYGYEETALRPSTALPPHAPPASQPLHRSTSIGRAQTTLDDPFGPDQPLENEIEQDPEPEPQSAEAVLPDRSPETFRMPSAISSHAPFQHTAAPGTSGGAGGGGTNPSRTQNQTPPATFSSLYQMLADERSARRKLESQLKNLRQEISDLHVQVNSSSSIMQSARSSYMLAGSSTRLQEILRETESSPPGTAPNSPQRDAGATAGVQRQLNISRFSGSESEAGPAPSEYDDVATPYEHYRTPREERSLYSLASGRVGNNTDDAMSEMF